MILRLKMFFLGFCCITAATIKSVENPFIPLAEVLKASGLAQKQLGYTNDIPYLINNGNTWALIAALSLKYGYNHFSDKPFKNLDFLNSAHAFDDYKTYSRIAEDKYKNLLLEKSKQSHSQANRFELGRDGLILMAASLIAYKFLGLAIINPLKYLVLAGIAYAGCTGFKKAYDAYNYQEYLDTRIEDNKYIKALLGRAKEQLKSKESFEQDAKQIMLDLKDKAKDKIQKIQDKIKKIRGE